MIRRSLLIATLGLLGGCAGSAPFTPMFPNGGVQLERALARAEQAGSPAQPALLVGVTDAPRGVFAYDLDARKLLFREPAQVTAMPSIAGELAVVPEDEQVTVRRIRDGSIVKTIPRDGMHLVGADGDGKLAVVVLSTGGAINVRSRLVLFEGERVSAEREVPRALGAPAVLGGLAFVPHMRVHVSVLDAQAHELARVRIGEDVASQAFRHQGAIYFGEHGFYRLDSALAREAARSEAERPPQQGAHYWKFAPQRKLPGTPPLFADSNAPPPPIDSALYRVCLSALPGPLTADGKLTLQDDALYLSFYKQLFSLTPDAVSAHWVYESKNDLVGIRALPGGLLAVDSEGLLTALDGNGRPTTQFELGVKPIAARIRAERLPGGSASGEIEAIEVALDRAARNPDTRLVPSRAFAAQLLQNVEDDRAAHALITLCNDAQTPPRVREQACESLTQRSVPSQAVLDALAVEPNWLEDVTLPAVGPLALAALHAHDARAAGPLAQRLFEPALPLEDLPPLLKALAGLGDPGSAQPLADFLKLYHADANDDATERALVAGMDALLTLDPTRARSVLGALASDQQARGGVRVAAEQRLTKLGPTEDEAAVATSAEAVTPGAAPAGPPAHLTSQHIEDALSPVRPKLARCVREAPDRPASARLVLVIEGDGRVAEVRALPASTQACARPLVEEVRFPATKFGRRTIMSYSVSR